MNTTTLRSAVRDLLSDPPGGIYTDAMIDAAASIAYHRVRAEHPEPVVIALSPAPGDDTLTLPHAVITVRSVSTGKWVVPPATHQDIASPAHSRAALAYTAGPTTIWLSRPITDQEAGAWVIHATWVPPIPPAPSTAWDLPAELDGAVIYHTAADLIRQRQTSQARRGGKADYTISQQADAWTRDAVRITRGFRKVARMT